MGHDLITAMVTIATAIVGVAIISVLVSKNAQTGSVLSAAGSAFGQDLGVAISPITGQAINFSNAVNISGNSITGL